jgi:hypothetical protein
MDASYPERDMDDRNLIDDNQLPPDVVLRSPPNWTAIVFLGTLGTVHLAIAIPSFVVGRWEGFLSLILGIVFIAVAVMLRISRHEIAIMPGRQCVKVRMGWRRFGVERTIPFSQIRGVRVTLAGGTTSPESRIELLCRDEDIECPPTPVPRQEALLLALAMNVPLFKAMDDQSLAEAARL